MSKRTTKASGRQKTVPSAVPREDLLSVAEAAESLDCTERNVWNLIKSHRLVAEKIRQRLWISRVEINRYRLFYKDTHLEHAFSRFPSADAAGFGKYVKFGPHDGDYSVFELDVTLEDWVRLVAKPPSTIAAYEEIRSELRDRIGTADENFTIRFKIDQASLALTLKASIHRVTIPRELTYLYSSEEDVRSLAFQHLLDHVLLRIDRVNGDPSDYLAKAVDNFYLDLLRKRARPEISFSDLDAEDIQSISLSLEQKDHFLRQLMRPDAPPGADDPPSTPHRKSKK